MSTNKDLKKNSYKSLPSLSSKNQRPLEPTYRFPTKPLTQAYPQFTLLQPWSPSSWTLWFSSIWCDFFCIFAFESKMHFKVTKIFYKLFGSLCDLTYSIRTKNNNNTLWMDFEVNLHNIEYFQKYLNWYFEKVHNTLNYLETTLENFKRQ